MTEQIKTADETSKKQPKKLTVKTVDGAMMLTSILQPITTFPQIFAIYTTQNASGVSIWMWLSSMLVGVIPFAYGVIHRLWPIIINQIIWYTIDIVIIIGIILYS